MKKNCRILRIASLLLCLLLLAGCSTTTQRPPEKTTGQGDLPVGGDGSQYTKRVALTYDDGPHVTRTKKIVDELAKYNYHATFFVLGNRVDGTAYNGADAMCYAAAAGNEIAIHGYGHTVLESVEIMHREMQNATNAIQKVLPGYTPSLMRPPEGSMSADVVAACPYPAILWSVDSEDWRYSYSNAETTPDAATRVQSIVNNVMNNLEDGDIILLHDIHESTYDATVVLLERLHAEGYEVVTVSELMGNLIQPGNKYFARPMAYG